MYEFRYRLAGWDCKTNFLVQLRNRLRNELAPLFQQRQAGATPRPAARVTTRAPWSLRLSSRNAMEAMDVSPSYVDGGEFTSEVASTMRRCFDHFDADGDGALSHAEFSGVYQCECAATAAAPPPSPSPPAAARHWHGLCAHTGWPLSGRMLFNHKPLRVCGTSRCSCLPSNTRATTRAHPNT